jgi:SHS2 domain-containing protein
MKSRIYQVLNDSADYKVTYFGCNHIDIFYNALEGFRRLIYKKNPNRPEPAKPDYPVVHETFKITGKNYEEMFTEWMRQLLAFTQSHRYLPLYVDAIDLQSKSLMIQISFRMAMKRDKENVPLKAVAYQPAKLEKVKSGYQITVTYDI